MDETDRTLSIMFGEVGRFADMLEETLEGGFDGKIDSAGIDRIILMGMGGSGIAGDIVKDCAVEDCAVPVIVWKHPDLPAWAGPGTLVAISSYSGNTRETVEAFDQAVERGCRVVTLTQGGKLLKRSEELGIPMFRYSPGVQPRSALPAGMVGFALLLDKVAGTDYGEDIRRAAPDLGRLSRRYSRQDSLPSKIAESIGDRSPVIYCPPDIPGAGIRWKGQVSENAKTVAGIGIIDGRRELPEWSRRDISESFVPVFLYEEDAPRSVKTEFDACIDDVKKRGVDAKVIKIRGTTILQKSTYAILLGDYVSLYMAKRKHLDPMNVSVIKHLKEMQSDIIDGKP